MNFVPLVSKLAPFISTAFGVLTNWINAKNESALTHFGIPIVYLLLMAGTMTAFVSAVSIMFGYPRRLSKKTVTLENVSRITSPPFASQAQTVIIRNTLLGGACAPDSKRSSVPISESTKEFAKKISTISMPQYVSSLETLASQDPIDIGRIEFQRFLGEEAFLYSLLLRGLRYPILLPTSPETLTTLSKKSSSGSTTTTKPCAKKSSSKRKRTSKRTTRTRIG